MDTVKQSVHHLRWRIGGLLFASTVINYIDRQTLSLLAPDLKRIYSWTNSDYAALGIAFRIAYSIGQTVFGRLLDRLGTKRGLTATVACYSAVSILTSLANSYRFGFCLGWGNPAIGPEPPRPFPNGFPVAIAVWRLLCLIAARRSAARLHRLWCYSCTRISVFIRHSLFLGCLVSAG